MVQGQGYLTYCAASLTILPCHLICVEPTYHLKDYHVKPESGGVCGPGARPSSSSCWAPMWSSSHTLSVPRQGHCLPGAGHSSTFLRGQGESLLPPHAEASLALFPSLNADINLLTCIVPYIEWFDIHNAERKQYALDFQGCEAGLTLLHFSANLEPFLSLTD